MQILGWENLVEGSLKFNLLQLPTRPPHLDARSMKRSEFSVHNENISINKNEIKCN